MTDRTLIDLIAGLAAIEQAGLLEGCLLDCTAERRGWPRSDADRYPLRMPYVRTMARHAAVLLGLPDADCEPAAREALLPDTRLRQVERVVARYMARIVTEPPPEPEPAPPTTEATPADDAALARARRRRP